MKQRPFPIKAWRTMLKRIIFKFLCRRLCSEKGEKFLRVVHSYAHKVSVNIGNKELILVITSNF
jgi:hypothetical protein